MDSNLLIGLCSAIGTFAGTIISTIGASRLTNYRLSEMEKKIDAQSEIGTRLAVVENTLQNIDERQDATEKRLISIEGVLVSRGN